MKHFHILIWFDSYNNPEISQMDIITFYRWKTNDSHKFTHLISGEVTTQIIQVFFLLHRDWVLSIGNYLLANLTKALYFFAVVTTVMNQIYLLPSGTYSLVEANTKLN